MQLDRWTTCWLTACMAIALHLAEEAFNGSYGFYSDLATILSVIAPTTPLRPFQFEVWLLNITGAITVLIALTPLVHARRRIMVTASFLLAIMMTANATVHIVFSVLTRQMLAGTPTSLLLLMAALFLITSVPENVKVRAPGRA